MSSLIEVLEEATRFLFFTGKGGVGKTSLSCATAIALARRGKRALLVSTDPASNLDEVLETELSSEARPVPGCAGLFALNIDPMAAAHAYRERVVGPYRGILPDAAIGSMEEQLSGACTVEIAAFDEFVRLMGDEAVAANFDHIVFDTAPTGHTLRLLKLPGAWSSFIATNTTGATCLGPVSGLQAGKDIYQLAFRSLSDTATTTLALVSRPDPAALSEANRTRAELAEMGVLNQRLFLNGVFWAANSNDETALALEARGCDAVQNMPESLALLPRIEVPLLPFPLIGLRNLERVFNTGDHSTPMRPQTDAGARELSAPLWALIDEIEQAGRGVIMTMGKGGVGKTTVAAAIAVELAYRGHNVTLTTTDPAAHVASVVGEDVPGLRVEHIDPSLETERYIQEVLAKADLDTDGRALLEEDLRSPCTEEIAVFRAFAEAIAQGEHRFVVLDTAPTGHTILLLDATEAYHREVLRTRSDVPESVRSLLPRLRDPAFTSVLIVTLPESTPVHEAARLQDDLQRAGIKPFAWVVNGSFGASSSSDSTLIEYGRRELPFIKEIQSRLTSRMALIPWTAELPVGADQLRKLVYRP